MATISNTNLLSQSPYLYLQGAGSDGTDGSASGVHLRWDFGESLSELHIPKGNLAVQGSTYYSTAGFNKANDFVKIYRTSYSQNFPIIIDFADMIPSSIVDEAGKTKTWIYRNIAPVPGLKNNTCNVLIRFSNPIKYNEVKLQFNPVTNCLNFLKNYNDIIEVEVEGRLMFSAFVQMQAINLNESNVTQIESISRTNKDGEEPFISNRKKYVSGDSSFLLKEDLDFLLQENGGYLEIDKLGAGKEKIMAENIQYIRFRGNNCFPTLLWLETYHDFLLGKNQLSDWQSVTQLSLETDTNIVFNRLENASHPIHGRWPKYQDGATVNVENYKSRWLDDVETGDEGLRSGIINYLNLSKAANNLEAAERPSSAESAVEECSEEFKFSYLTLLKLAAFDFHVARMLGFGHIDTGMSVYDKYMYIAVYETTAALDGMPATWRTHTFMTLPVGMTDYKLPVTPQLKELKYGMSLTEGQEVPIAFTDEKGYSKYGNSRAIGLCVEPFSAVMEDVGEFFFPDEEYSYVEDYTEPIQFGIAYKSMEKTEWSRPEINNDPDFQDPRGINEPIPVIRPDTTDDKIFTHFETEEGIHEYAVYGINWFSRVSPLSNIQQTDETSFPVRNTLLPPLNLGVQIIQKEDGLILTTQAEQDKLAQLANEPDKTLVRVTFEWNNIQASNYTYGDEAEAEFFFREEMPNFVKGQVKSVTKIGLGLYDVRTKSYNITSTNPIQIVSPIVPAGKENRFIGSILTTDDDQFEIQSVRQSNVSGEGAIFTVKAIENRQLVETEGNVQQVVNGPEAPIVGSIFSAPENISLTTGWPLQLTQKVRLKKFSDYSETDIDSEGNETQLNIGGIFEKASIIELLDVDDYGSEIPGSKTGVYRITFNEYKLLPHEDLKVEWYKGSVRVKDDKGEARTLEVWSIEREADGTPTPTLQLIACDGTFNVDEHYNSIPLLDEEQNPIPDTGYRPIPVGQNIDVNYHPGYRVYFTYEAGFNQATLLPATGAGSKKTLIACRSTDINEKAGKLASPLSSPGIIQAREIIEPVAPEKPSGALFANRPNFFGKANYTFDTKVVTTGGRQPYALVFYRANEQIILDALYKHDTVLRIQRELAGIENDTFFTDRWNELVNVKTDETSKQFKEWNGYRFPNPDKATNAPFIFDASINPGSSEKYKNAIKLVINNAFLPLTEQPVIYRYLKSGYQTSDRKPVIRDGNGELIMPGSASYDGSPMATRFQNAGNSMVRFTDYTLDGASTSVFFYYAVEMSNTLAMSERSEILGPIQLINAAAPKAPEIRKFYPRVEDSFTEDTTAVLFDINVYPEAEGISKILLYRALNATDAMSIRTMKLAATINVNEPIIDDFSDMDFYPYGEVLYYRLVAVRTVKTAIKDKDSGTYEMEDIPSYPTAPVLANIIDVNNPVAPELTYTAELIENMLENVAIEWEPTIYNGTYHLYQMNNSGNWVALYSIKTNDPLIRYELPAGLSKTDEDGAPLYYRFKVTVENTSGLISLEDKIITI